MTTDIDPKFSWLNGQSRLSKRKLLADGDSDYSALTVYAKEQMKIYLIPQDQEEKERNLHFDWNVTDFR